MKLDSMDLKNANRSVLVYGLSGSGKTVFAAGFPKPLIFDFDGKISSAASFYAGRSELAQIEYENYADKKDFARFYTKLQELRKTDPAKFPYRTVVLDSITTFADSLMSEVIRQNPADASKRSKVNETLVPHLKDYQIAISHVKDIVRQVLTLPCLKVFTAHIQQDKDEVTGEVLYQPLIWGKDLPQWLPMVFEEVYRTYAETKDGKLQLMAQTRAERKYVARSQIPGLPNPLNLAEGYSAWSRYL